MCIIRKVTVIGVSFTYTTYLFRGNWHFQASGNVGRPLVAALIDSGFEVTAITRLESTATFPTEVLVKSVDINNAEALSRALEGQDAVMSTVSTVALSVEKNIIDAAIAAKVKRIIPCEFGINTQEARGTKIGGLLRPKIENIDYLVELSKKHDWFSWTGLSTGSFFDWVGSRSIHVL